MKLFRLIVAIRADAALARSCAKILGSFVEAALAAKARRPPQESGFQRAAPDARRLEPR
jgi:hypothetical protein